MINSPQTSEDKIVKRAALLMLPLQDEDQFPPIRAAIRTIHFGLHADITLPFAIVGRTNFTAFPARSRLFAAIELFQYSTAKLVAL